MRLEKQTYREKHLVAQADLCGENLFGMRIA